MADTPNYNEASASGSKWQRACRVVIENPYNSTPSIVFVEETIFSLDGEIIQRPVANVSVAMDPADPLHGMIYYKLNELYTLLREARDAAANPPPVEPPPETPVIPEP